MKSKAILLIAAVLLALCVSGCEKAETKEAKLNGMLVIDVNGRQWLLQHHIGDTYFIYSVNMNGSVNLP